MAQVDFRKKINWRRHYRLPQGVKAKHEILRIFESDRGHIVNSPAIRRLQQKTQVFPLERNAAVHTHLTHSMKAQQMGRYVAREILNRLKELKLLEVYGLDELTGPFENIVEVSYLIHDIGNPPFGHFGEAVISSWFRQRLYPEDARSQSLINDRYSVAASRLWDGEEPLNALRRKVRQDLCYLEDNTQSVRLMHALMRVNLTWAQTGGILKYTRPTQWRGETLEARHYLMKRPGCYFSEETYITRLRKELNLALYSRFPLAWIMEVADDISYCVADLGGTVERRIFTTEQLYHHLHEAWGQHEKGSLFSLVVENAWEKSCSNSSGRSMEDQFFIYLWVGTLNKLVPYAAQRFIDNLLMVFTGASDHALLEDASECSDLLKLYKGVAVKHVFSHPGTGRLELQGYRVVNGLLEIYHPLLNLPLSGFIELIEKGRVKRFPIETCLSRKLLAHHQLTCVEAINKLLSDSPELPLWRYHHRYYLLQDYISGMTDLYAWDEY